jgi:hypothetical protein
MDRAVVEALWAEMYATFGLKKIADGFYAHHRRFLASTWRQAIQETLLTGETIRSVMFVERVAERIVLRASQPVNGHRPPPRRVSEPPLPPPYVPPPGLKPKKSRLPEECRSYSNPNGVGE